MLLESKLRNLFLQNPDVLYGFTGIGYSPYAKAYRSALVFAVPYGIPLALGTYQESALHQGIQQAKENTESILRQVADILQKDQVRYWIPPAAQENETELLALFSFKTAAVHAGLGWIGKNDVLISEKYGPRVRLSAVLIDAEFEYGQPVTASKCPVDCTSCIDVCPCGALKNRLWTIDAQRDELIDFQKCNRMRSASIEKLGRKNECGLCMAACPYGLQADICAIQEEN